VCVCVCVCVCVFYVLTYRYFDIKLEIYRNFVKVNSCHNVGGKLRNNDNVNSR